MSTPTTATAALPHYNPHYSFPHHQPYQESSTATYRVNNPSTSRLAYPSAGYFAASTTTTAITVPPNGMTISSTSSGSIRIGPEETPTTARNTTNYATMSIAPHAPATMEPQRARKRRRSREPDWGNFYKNGLPKEIIVIDDTPEPEPAKPPAKAATQPTVKDSSTISTTLTASHTSNGLSNNPPSTRTSARYVAKKRKRDDKPIPYDPVYHSVLTETRPDSLHHHATPCKSTSSSDRTTSANHTTAATSLDSLSSTTSQDYYEVQAGQKRKRTTRQQIATDAQRREAAGVTDAYISYRPPPYPPKKAADVPVKVIQDSSYHKNGKVDDDDGHYIVVPDADLTERYQMVKLLGQGTFGKVVQARDRKRAGGLVAIKIIRSVQKYRDASKIELRVLATLKANDEQNRNRCIHLRDCFDFRGHICIVMDLLGQSVFDFLKGNNFVPFPNSQIQSFARQLFTSVAFLHDLNLIHTDLKPENILLCHNEYQTFTYNRKIPSSSTTVCRQATQRRVLLDTEIRLIDFGSATFNDEYHSSVVSTRHYRAPEIILGLGWSYPCDIWSIGCILVEFFTGDALFQTHDNLEHLAMMEAVVNSRIDTQLVAQVNRLTRGAGNPAAKYFKRLKLDYPSQETTRASRRFVKAMKRLDEIIPANTHFLQQFLDLLGKIFVYDPNKRITARQALEHPWFKEVPHPDDGSEAARIRMDKMRTQQNHRLHPLHAS